MQALFDFGLESDVDFGFWVISIHVLKQWETWSTYFYRINIENKTFF